MDYDTGVPGVLRKMLFNRILILLFITILAFWNRQNRNKYGTTFQSFHQASERIGLKLHIKQVLIFLLLVISVSCKLVLF